MAFWFSPYNSSAEQQFHETLNEKQEVVDAEILAEAVVKSFNARLGSSNWSFQKFAIRLESQNSNNVCSEYEAELLAPGDEFLMRLYDHLRYAKITEDEKTLIKKVGETYADDRYLKQLQVHFSCLQIHSSEGRFICQFTTKRAKIRYLCVTVTMSKTNDPIETSTTKPKITKSPRKMWRLFKSR